MRRFLAGWLCLLFCLPFLAAGFYAVMDEGRTPVREISGLQIAVDTLDGERRLGVTEFLTGVVAGQIDADYEMETLKAQAIIARTCLFQRAGDRQFITAAETGLDWRSEARRRQWWGLDYHTYNDKIMEAVQSTDGMVIRYDGSLITPAWFALGNGQTRSGLEAWGTEIPWLQSEESEWDETAAEYETVLIRTRRQIIAQLRAAISDFDCSVKALAATFEITEKDSAGYVQQLQVGNSLLSGEDFRYALDLPSACFDLDFDGNQVTITVRGSGHGVGFDQYGANCQALEGKDCEELLRYYFADVEIGE